MQLKKIIKFLYLFNLILKKFGEKKWPSIESSPSTFFYDKL